MTETRESYVAVMDLRGQLVAVRGGSTTGPWSRIEVQVVGRRLEAEIAGQFKHAQYADVWAQTNLPPAISAAEYMVRACPGEAARIRQQYNLDPLVTGAPEEL